MEGRNGLESAVSLLKMARTMAIIAYIDTLKCGVCRSGYVHSYSWHFVMHTVGSDHTLTMASSHSMMTLTQLEIARTHRLALQGQAVPLRLLFPANLEDPQRI